MLLVYYNIFGFFCDKIKYVFFSFIFFNYIMRINYETTFIFLIFHEYLNIELLTI